MIIPLLRQYKSDIRRYTRIQGNKLTSVIHTKIWYIFRCVFVTSFFVVLTSILRLAAVRKERAEKWIAEGAVRVVHGILLFPVVLQAQWPDCRGKKKLLSMVRYHGPPTPGWCLRYFQRWKVSRLSCYFGVQFICRAFSALPLRRRDFVRRRERNDSKGAKEMKLCATIEDTCMADCLQDFPGFVRET